VSVRNELTELLGIEIPLVQAPMAGSSGSALAIAASQAGALGSLPCATLDPDGVRDEVAAIRSGTDRPFNVNFFCHEPPGEVRAAIAAWIERLAQLFAELGVEPPEVGDAAASRASFDDELCGLVEELRPPVVSFHFGLPDDALVDRVKATGAVVLSSATSVAEASWLVDRGCDAVIAQGVEAGGHRGMFLTDDPAAQVGTFALVPLVADAVSVPVIAAGAIADGRGMAAALALGASGVQIGTAFLRCPEALTGPLHRAALAVATEDSTVLTNVVTGRPARGIANRLIREIGPLSVLAPPFPTATAGTGPLRAAAEALGSADFSPLWCGQAVPLARDVAAGQLVHEIAAAAREAATTLADRLTGAG
jgi:nitronate monooxygenase